MLKHQIAKTRGRLDSQNLLGQLAQQFGKAIGGYGALRDALAAMSPKAPAGRRATVNALVNEFFGVGENLAAIAQHPVAPAPGSDWRN